MSEVVLRGGTILTLDSDHQVLAGDVAAIDGAIVHVGGNYTPQTTDYAILDCVGCVVMPGFVQAHIHTCQTLARGRADELELLDWLHQVIWPYEASLDERSITAAAELACAELLLGGTTSILDMGTVHHTDQLFMAAERSGIRATIGKAMMDAPDPAIPQGLRETTMRSLDESARLAKRWHGAAAGDCGTPTLRGSCCRALTSCFAKFEHKRRARVCRFIFMQAKTVPRLHWFKSDLARPISKFSTILDC